jgi:L-lactate utilization protein LutB
MGGKTFSSGNVKLQYNNNEIKCSVCSSNNYEEVIGSINKSKVRTGIRNMFLGSESGDIDNTSVITYFCSNCGFCVMVRNNGSNKITATKI